jgi:cytoskeletal protein CcmA (bactofilin family)
MSNDTKSGSGKGRSLAKRVAARALGLEPSEMDSQEGRSSGLKNPFTRERGNKDRDENDDEIIPNCHIGVGSNFRGTLMIEGTLLVDGEFEGDILNCECIVVGPYGHVRADVHVREAIVAGVFDGGIQAEERILLLSGARVKGDLTSHAIVMEEGVRFSGSCVMLDEATGGEPLHSGGVTTRGGGTRST